MQTMFRLRTQKIIQTFAVGGGEIRQIGLTQLQGQITTLGDLHAVLQRFRKIREQCHHLGLGFEILLRSKLAHAPLVVQDISFGDADACLVRFVGFLA